jgi:hypothetical protein
MKTASLILASLLLLTIGDHAQAFGQRWRGRRTWYQPKYLRQTLYAPPPTYQVSVAPTPVPSQPPGYQVPGALTPVPAGTPPRPAPRLRRPRQVSSNCLIIRQARQGNRLRRRAC